MKYVWCILAVAAGSWAAPAESPLRVELPVYDQPQDASSVLLARPLERENAGGEERSDKGLVNTIISHKLHAASNLLANKLAPVHSKGGIFSPPVTSLEGVLFEDEELLSKKISIKDNIHHMVAGIFQPKPIVDTIREEEKYGNDGDKFYAAGRALVGGAENLSNFVNTVLEVPSKVFKKITRVATEKLNNIGGKLVGL